MKTLFILCLICLGTQLTNAQMDTLNLDFRDKEVQLLSDENGNGSKAVTFDDGLRKTRVFVDFNAEETSRPNSPIQNYFVKKHPNFVTKTSKKIYHTLDLKFGLIWLAGFRPETNYLNRHSWSGALIHEKDFIGNKILESKYHAINWGLDIPTKYKRLNILTGVGLSSQRVYYNNGLFSFSKDAVGYHHIGRFDREIIALYHRQNTYIYTSAINIPLAIKFNLKKSRYITFGINNRFQFRATQRQRLDNDIEYSYLGLIYKNRTEDVARPLTKIYANNNFSKFNLDATLSYGRGMFSLFAKTNITPMFKRKFHQNEFEYDQVNRRSFKPHSIRFGVQINIW